MVILDLAAVREDAGTVSRHERPHLPRLSPCWLARALRLGAQVILTAALSGLHHCEMSAACLTSSSVIAMRGGPALLPSEFHPGPGLRKVEINSPQKRRGDPALTGWLLCAAPQPALKVSRQPEDAPRGPRTLNPRRSRVRSTPLRRWPTCIRRAPAGFNGRTSLGHTSWASVRSCSGSGLAAPAWVPNSWSLCGR
jgi:hypothetical protein